MKTVAIIGRPNVGKSTLFNRLVGRRAAIVHDTPGVTRDRKTEPASLGDINFNLVDTAGLEKSKQDIEGQMFAQTEQASNLADILILMVDGFAGLTEEDKHFAKWARKKGKPIILVVNKCERTESSILDAMQLGFENPIAISAEHGLGLEELYTSLKELLGEEEASEEFDEEEEEPKQIQLALVGRPNVGKSTITNKILNQERVITSPIAGTTRDAIAIDWEYSGHNIRLIDTAGMRKKSNINQKLERYSVSDSLNAVKFAHVAILVLDATEAFEKQDLKIANLIIQEGRAVIIVINKWDLRKEKNDFNTELNYMIKKYMNDVPDVRIVKCSAKNDASLNKIIDSALDAYQSWNMRITTGKLNAWLEAVLESHPPPISKGRRIKIRFVTQVKSRPPTFMLSTSQPENLPAAYEKYLRNNLAKTFNIVGVPIRMMMRKKENPYKKS